ncbi:hypothetical protein N9B82_04955 [Saprospiraceae bacterium]|nr:hypothetical protein [Saprospiraceae bacterium]
MKFDQLTYNLYDNLEFKWYYISISPESKEEATKLFDGLSSGGTISSPLQDTFWGAYFGTFTDKFGVHWMVNYLKA